MSEKLVEVFELYDMEVKNTKKGRGATILSTEKGLHILEAFHGNFTRLEQEYVLKQLLVENGFPDVDEIIPNRDGILFTCDRYRQPFVMKKHFVGEECDMHNEEDMERGVYLLARLHKSGRRVAELFDSAWQKRRQEKEKKRLQEIQAAFENGEELERLARVYDIRENLLKEMLEQGEPEKETLPLESKSTHLGEEIKDVFVRHNQELAKIYKYVQRVKKKNDFEKLFLQIFPRYYRQGVYCVKQLDKSNGDEFITVAKEYYGICHGAYNHHNIILDNGQEAVVHFERFSKGNQLNDLYQFTRKTMEKNHYDIALLEKLLHAYNDMIPLTQEAYHYIYLLFCYPEKFWKIANGYYNGNKAFLSPKYVEKLQAVICQEEEKFKMLGEYFSFHLV